MVEADKLTMLEEDADTDTELEQDTLGDSEVDTELDLLVLEVAVGKEDIDASNDSAELTEGCIEDVMDKLDMAVSVGCFVE